MADLLFDIELVVTHLMSRVASGNYNPSSKFGFVREHLLNFQIGKHLGRPDDKND